MTSLAAKIDTPSVAASGASVYVAYTNVASGTISLRVSRDRGVKWTRRSMATVAAAGSESGEHLGMPLVVASGSNVALFWNDGGVVHGRISRDSGVHWGAMTHLGSGWLTSAHALGARIAIAARDVPARQVGSASGRPGRGGRP